MTQTIALEGTEKLIENLSKVNADLRGEVGRKAVHAGALQIENRARINAPVLTGALRNSASTISRITGNGAEAEIGFRGLAYAKIQEYGGKAGRNHSVYIVGKHYLENAINSEGHLAVAAMNEVIRAYLE